MIIGTGGSIGNVNFRRMFDPRLTEEYCGLAGMPWSDQDASGEIAAMAIGAALWGLFNQTGEFGYGLTKAGRIGCQYGYQHLNWQPDSQVFASRPRDRSCGGGLAERHPRQHARPAVLRRDRPGSSPPTTTTASSPTCRAAICNAKNITYNPNNFLNAAMAGIGDGHNGGGPIWAIFDAEAVAREKWVPEPPFVDIAEGLLLQRRARSPNSPPRSA